MKRKHLFERMAQALDLATEPIPGKPLIEIVNDRSVLIENHCGVISYSSESITIKTKIGCILICGSGLVLSRMSKEQLRISGFINKVELKGRRI